MSELVDGRCTSCGHRPEHCPCTCCAPAVPPRMFTYCQRCRKHIHTRRYAWHNEVRHG